MLKCIKYISAIIPLWCIFFFGITINVFSQQKSDSIFAHNEEGTLNLYGSGSNIFLNFYQEVISPVKGGNNCPMYPSCSQFSKLAFNKHPVHKASLLTIDRLLRCGHELNYYQEIKVDGYIRWFDPINKFDSEDKSVSLSSISDSAHQEYLHGDEFAENLLSTSEYMRASIEFQRLWFYEQDTVKKINYLFKSGLCLFDAQDYNSFITFSDHNKKYFNSFPELKAHLELFLAKSYYMQKNYGKAITILYWSGIKESNPLYDELNYYTGLSYLRLFMWNSAIDYFKKINEESSYGKSVKKIKSNLSLVDEIPSRSPLLAGVASAVIPGLGYMYSNRPGTAITSFILNSLFAFAVYTSAKKENYGLSVLVGAFGLSWYTGNIYGSVNAAKEFNAHANNKFIDDLLEYKQP